MRKIFGISTTLGLLLLVSFTVGAQGAPGNADQQLKAGCRELAHDYPATGHACRAMNGLLAYFSPAGEFQGYTHGPDPKGADDEPFNATVPVGGPAVGNASALPQDKPVQCVAGTAG
ncbi:MAG: hypothetical protein QOI63_497, partial [Thermoplasmata archaeon]|nr:hypothetical protein [Thermoplasmata archaeon]